jgi:sphingolipid C9-methyltransferase
VMEKANFEAHSVENITIHYGLTIQRWYDNWISNQAEITAAYGDRWFRIWRFFLAWSTIIAEQGNAACFQVVLNKNLDSFDRMRFITSKSQVLGDRTDFLDFPRSPDADQTERLQLNPTA